MSHKSTRAIAVIGIDIGKNSFHAVGQDKRGEIVLRQKWSRGQVECALCQPVAPGADERSGWPNLTPRSRHAWRPSPVQARLARALTQPRHLGRSELGARFGGGRQLGHFTPISAASTVSTSTAGALRRNFRIERHLISRHTLRVFRDILQVQR